MIMRSQSLAPGGAGVPGGQIGMMQTARSLTQIGVDVRVFVGGAPTDHLRQLDDGRATYFQWPAWVDRMILHSPAPLKTRAKRLRRDRWLHAIQSTPGIASADVIHVQGLEDGEALLTRLGGPLVVTHWGRVGRWQPNRADAERNRDLERRIERIREGVRLVAIGEAQAEELRTAGMPPVDIIPPGIDLRRFAPGDRGEARRRLGLSVNGGEVLYVGRLTADKNVETLLKAFARLLETRTAHLLIVGDGPLRGALGHLSETLGVAKATTFVPFVPHEELPPYYHAADVAVVPSDRLETFCMVALEAVACACPLIVTDQVPEILRRFPYTRSVSTYDADALCVQLRSALDGGVPAADRAGLSEYDWTSVTRRYLEVYGKALRTPAGGP